MKEEIIAEAHRILEDTKKEQERFLNERKVIYSLMENEDDKNIEILKSIIEIYKKVCVLESKTCYSEAIINSLKELKKQNVRKSDNKNETQTINIFEIKDKNNKKYTFFSRENAKEYMNENTSNFEGNEEIKVIKNENMDLERIIELIEI